MGKGRKQFNRFLASVLSLALVFTGMSFQWMPVMAAEVTEFGAEEDQAENLQKEEPGTEAAEEEISSVGAENDDLILYYDFVSQNDQAAQIPDASKHGNIAEIEAVSGSARGKYELIDANIYGKQVKALDLVGGADGAFLWLPDGILSECDAVTISTWVKLTTNNGYQRIWDFGSGTTSYIDLLSDGWNAGFEGYAVNINHNGSGEIGVSKGKDANGNPINIAKNRWVLTTVVMDGSVMSLYENGELIGTKDTGITVKDLGNTTQNYIAYSQWGDDPTTGQYAEFKIYNRALSADEIAAMYDVTDDGIIAADKAELNLGDTTAVIADLKLPSKGVNGSDIAWTSQNSAVTIGAKGEDGNYTATVTRPKNGAGDVTGTLTASISYGTGTAAAKTFTVTVAEEYSAQKIAEHDMAAAKEAVGSLSSLIKKTITLPAIGEWGSAIAWNWQGKKGIIEIPAQKDENGNIIAQVNRPDIGMANEKGVLSATVTSGTASVSMNIDVTVLAYRESVGIRKIEPVSVTTLKGRSPSLPNFVKVTRTDDSIDKMKVVWPAEIEAEKYSETGTFQVTGQILGEFDTITADVTVVEEEEVVKTVLSESFDLNDISLDKIGKDGSILTQNRERDIAYLKLLDNKRMLYDFYMTFGENDKIADVKPLGGWDAPTGLLRGHSTGHYMSALALAYASTGDKELKDKLDEMVSELHRLQQKSKGNAADFKMSGPTMQESLDTATWSTDPNEWGEGFISAYSPDQFALLEVYAPYGSPGSGIWAPYYTLHKLFAGFLDAYKYTGNKEALATAKALGKWVYNRLSACSQEQLTKMWDMYIAGEFGGMNESLAQLYIYAKADGDADADIYMKAAKLFDNTTFFNNLVKNLDDIQGRHANQHIPQIIGAMKVYEATTASGKSDMYYYDIAKNFWEMTVSRYAYSIGGVGTGEAFTEPYKQAANISGDRNCETCAAYNMLKLTMMLNNYDPNNAEYMDYYERTLYNQILASQTPNVTDKMHNGTTYMLPIGPGTVRDFGDDYNSFTCCHGTGMENHVKYQEAAYAKTADALYVGLYLPSTVTWDEKGVKVVQETTFPSATTKLTVQALAGQTAKAFDMKLRVPYWATNGFAVKVNGQTKMTSAEVSTYVTVDGVKANDVIEITMPYTLHLDKTPDTLENTAVASIMYGPFVMPAQNESTAWQKLDLPENLGNYFTVSTNESNGFPVLSGGGYQFAPMFAPEYATEPYHTYFRVTVVPDDGSNWYQVDARNNTPAYGTITTNAKGAMVKGGTDLVVIMEPNRGYAVKKLTINGEEVQDKVKNNMYVVENVSGDLEIRVNYRPPVLDPLHLEYSADIASDRANDNDNWYGMKEDVNSNWEPAASSGHAKGWVNWYTPMGSECYLWYTWDEPVTMNTFDIYWRIAPAGWMKVPGTLGISYKDNTGAWKKANMTTSYEDAVKPNQYNTICFDTITTTAVRLDMTINTLEEGDEAGCTGVYRWKVSNNSKETLDSAIKAAQAKKEEDYNADSWAAMQAALAAAVALDQNATADQIYQAMAALDIAVNSLSGKAADKKALTASIEAAEKKVQQEYSFTSFRAMQVALNSAKELNAADTALQSEVDAAKKALDEAVTKLEVLDRTKLEAAIEAAGKLAEKDYTAESWRAFKKALSAAKEVRDSIYVDQAKLDAAEASLRNILVKVTDRSKLAALIAEADKKAEKDYTAESWKIFKAALDAAKEVNGKISVTQNEVDTAKTNLENAMKALVTAFGGSMTVGTPTSVKATWKGGKKVSVTFKPAEHATKYEIYRSYSKGDKGYKKIGTVNAKANAQSYSYTDKFAAAGKTVYYKVLACNNTIKGSYSKVAKVTTLAVPKVKTKVKKKTVTISYDKVKNASGYEIYRGKKKNGKYKKAATIKKAATVKKVFKNVKKGTYYYKVRAYKTISKKKVYTAFSSPKKAKVK